MSYPHPDNPIKSPLILLIESLRYNLMVNYVDYTAIIPLGHLQTSDERPTEIESLLVITMKNPNTFDISYEHVHTSSDQKIVEKTISDASLEEARKFLISIL